jgi:hypothetical protein
MAGANFENFEYGDIYITLATSHDPAVVKKIHTHTKKTIDEFAKMAGTAGKEKHGHKGHQDHKGHDHGSR